MTTLFTGRIHVSYGQFYVESRTDDFGGDLFSNLAGQSNGLCGAAVPGFLWLVTARHTGQVDLAVEALDSAPVLDDTWEEVVEASFRPASTSSWLTQWAGEASWPLELAEVDYRVRYCGLGMDVATESNEDQVLDRYLLQLWPAPAAPDAVLKQTSRLAAYYHRTAGEIEQPSPRPEPARPPLNEDAAASRRLLLEQSGLVSGPRLADIRGDVRKLMDLDVELVHALAAADPQLQLEIARWAAHRAERQDAEATEADPLKAVLGIVSSHGISNPELLAELRQAFPELFG